MTMKPQIVHEAEIHRQHVRLRIPIGVEIDGVRYTVDDWSVGGFGVESPMTAHQPGDRFPARLLFPFEDFELTLRLEAQLIYVITDPPRFGGRFVALSQGQLGLFRYIVDAYLSGEIVSGGDILSVVGGDEAGDARVQKLFTTLNEQTGGAGRLGRYLGMTAFAVAGLALVGVILFGLYQRFIVVATERAVIEAPTYRVAATAGGVLEAGNGGLLRRGDLVARITSANGSIELASPCECVLGEWLIQPGGTVERGEAVATLVAADQPLTVRAELPFADARRLRVGQAADVVVPGKARSYQGQIERIDFRLAGPRPGEPPDLRDPERMDTTVIIRTERPLDFENLGFPVTVRFL
jgi:alginate biosynthesis protein Alg44